MMKKVSHLANMASEWAGSPSASLVALTSLVVYLVIGCVLGFSESFNIIANTVMSAVSYILLFLLQHDQNRHSKAMQLKMDEIIRSNRRTDNDLIGIEHLSDEQIYDLSLRYKKLREEINQPAPDKKDG